MTRSASGRRHNVDLLVASSGNPMGRQVFETLMIEALRRQSPADISIRVRVVGGLRSHVSVDRRFPLGVSAAVPLPLARVIGTSLAPTAALSHRLDLRTPPRFGREIATAHDLPPLRFPDEGDLPRWFLQGTRKLAGIITPSQFAADEMHELLGTRRTWVVPYGLSPIYRDVEPAQQSRLTELGISGPYVIHAAGATLRKNLDGLADAWRALADGIEHQLVLVGPPHPRRDALFSNLPRTVLVGKLTPEEVAPLIAAASVVVVPSTYEGFGLPALEGMACGVPVVAANRGALPEVCADAALLVEPDADSLAEGLARAVNDESVRSRLSVAGPARASTFSWERAAQRYIDIYREVLA